LALAVITPASSSKSSMPKLYLLLVKKIVACWCGNP